MTDADRRYVLQFIDHAVERCEEANLEERLQVPRWVADLVAELQAVATSNELRIPTDTIAAHEQLLDLRQAYMPEPPAYDREQGTAEACEDCGQELRPDSRQPLCTRCQKKRKLEASDRPKVGAAR